MTSGTIVSEATTMNIIGSVTHTTVRTWAELRSFRMTAFASQTIVATPQFKSGFLIVIECPEFPGDRGMTASAVAGH